MSCSEKIATYNRDLLILGIADTDTFLIWITIMLYINFLSSNSAIRTLVSEIAHFFRAGLLDIKISLSVAAMFRNPIVPVRFLDGCIRRSMRFVANRYNDDLVVRRCSDIEQIHVIIQAGISRSISTRECPYMSARVHKPALAKQVRKTSGVLASCVTALRYTDVNSFVRSHFGVCVRPDTWFAP